MIYHFRYSHTVDGRRHDIEKSFSCIKEARKFSRQCVDLAFSYCKPHDKLLKSHKRALDIFLDRRMEFAVSRVLRSFTKRGTEHHKIVLQIVKQKA